MVTGIKRGLLRIVTIEEVVRQPQMRQRRRFPLADLNRWQQPGDGFAPLGDHDLLPCPGSRQKLGKAGAGFGDLVGSRRHERIQLASQGAVADPVSRCL